MKKTVILFLFCLFWAETLCAIENSSLAQSVLGGTWENSTRQIVFDTENAKMTIRLKTYYGLFLDKPYEIAFSLNENAPLLLNDCLYLEYWRQSSDYPNYYVPSTNVHEIKLDDVITDENIYAYYFFGDEKNRATRIRYWKCDVENYDIKESVSFFVQKNEFVCNKYILIGTQLYTCVKGRGVKVRNTSEVFVKDAFPDCAFLLDDEGKSFMVLSKPYLHAK